MHHIWLTRPLENSLVLKQQLEAIGAQAHIDPVLTPEYLPCPQLDIKPETCLIATSQHSLISFAKGNSARSNPLFVVGPATADCGHRLGFTDIRAAEGTVTDLISLIKTHPISQDRTLLYLRGEEITKDLKSALTQNGLDFTESILYRMIPKSQLSPITQDLLHQGQLTHLMLFSARSAEITCRLLSGFSLGQIEFLCLSEKIASIVRACNLGVNRIKISTKPDQNSMIQLLS